MKNLIFIIFDPDLGQYSLDDLPQVGMLYCQVELELVVRGPVEPQFELRGRQQRTALSDQVKGQTHDTSSVQFP